MLRLIDSTCCEGLDAARSAQLARSWIISRQCRPGDTGEHREQLCGEPAVLQGERFSPQGESGSSRVSPAMH